MNLIPYFAEFCAVNAFAFCGGALAPTAQRQVLRPPLLPNLRQLVPQHQQLQHIWLPAAGTTVF